jgi:hypothetical protein
MLQLVSIAAGAAVLGVSTTGSAAASPGAAGGDGAPAGDHRFATPATTHAAGVVTSYNGWPIGTPGSAIGVASYLVPGTSIQLLVKSGDVATVMTYVAGRFNAEVERLGADEVGGYDYRRNVNNPSVWSNHASGTAMDLNWVLHPNGAKGTFTAPQVAAIRRILATCGDVIYWGGDYSGTTDEMHFEINVPPGSTKLTALAAGIRRGAGALPVVSLRARVDNRYVTAEARGVQPLIANRTVVGPWEEFDMIAVTTDRIALRSHANDRYVCADAAGRDPLIANRTAIGPWETFTVIHNSDGSTSLQAVANDRYVTAENGGAKALIANRTAIGLWEKFDLLRD